MNFVTTLFALTIIEGIQLIQGQVISKDGGCSSSYIINTLEKVLLDPIFISTAAAN